MVSITPISVDNVRSNRGRRLRRPGHAATITVSTAAATLLGVLGIPANAATAAPNLGDAATFAVLGGATVTNTGNSVLAGSVGVSPGSAVTGFPPGLSSDATIHAADSLAGSAQAASTAAYVDTAGRPANVTVTSDLAGQTLTRGVYFKATSLGLTGTVTLDGENDPASVFIFQSGSDLITASSSRVKLIRGALACNVFWAVGSSATLGTSTAFVGTLMAQTSVSVMSGTTVEGRVLAQTGQVSLDDNVFTKPNCAAPIGGSTPGGTTGGTTTGGTTGGTTTDAITGGTSGGTTGRTPTVGTTWTRPGGTVWTSPSTATGGSGGSGSGGSGGSGSGGSGGSGSGGFGSGGTGDSGSGGGGGGDIPSGHPRTGFGGAS